MYNRILYLTLLLSVCTPCNLSAQECENALEDAFESLGKQNYDQIILLLTDCPPERLLEKTKKILAYELLALAYFNNDRVELTKGALHKLLDLQPGYAPQTPQYTEEFIGLVEEVKNERVQPESGSIFHNKWFWIGGAAATSVTAFLFFNRQETKVLPEAPDPPDFP